MKIHAKEAHYILHQKRNGFWVAYLYHWELVPIAPLSVSGHGYRLSGQWRKTMFIMETWPHEKPDIYKRMKEVYEKHSKHE